MNSKSFKTAQKTVCGAKGRPFTIGKVIQRLFNIDLYTYVCTYRVVSIEDWRILCLLRIILWQNFNDVWLFFIQTNWSLFAPKQY